MEIFVSAGEASSDVHCAYIVRELRTKAEISTFGLGGQELERAGTDLLLHSRDLAGGGGPLEVIGQIPARGRLQRDLEARLSERPPQGAILVDTGEINLRLAPLLRRFGVPTVYFIPPKIWVWRKHRLATIARSIDLVLSILPFEQPIYAARKIPFQYVGNPLLDQVPLTMSQAEAKAALNIDPAVNVLTMMPGSRHNEIRLQLDLFAETVRHFVAALPRSEPHPLILAPAAQAIDPGHIADALQSRLPTQHIKVVKEQSHACMKAARVALIKSGTSTLEGALLGVPMVIAYHASWSAEWIFRHIVRYRGFVGLANLILEPDAMAALGLTANRPAPVVPEMILDRCQPHLIAARLMDIYRDGPAREHMLAEFARVASLLAPPAHLGRSPIQAAAKAMWSVFSPVQTP